VIATSSLLTASSSFEAVAGLALTILPRTVTRLVLGAKLPGRGVAAVRACGMGVLFLGLACLPPRRMPDRRASGRAVRTLLAYNTLAVAGLTLARTAGGYRGVALMPAIVAHGAFAGLFAGVARRARS
jgi:hypothetical protein